MTAAVTGRAPVPDAGVVADVVVVGAGPVGLLLAGELASGGVSVVVLERLREPMTESRAAQLNTRTAELLRERGLAPLIDGATREDSGHFAGFPLDLSRLDSPCAGNWKTPQYRTEAALAERAVRLGADLRRGHELRGLRDEGDRVVCEVAVPGGLVSLTARYVVGCDGAAGTVRRLASIPCDEGPATRELLRADLKGVEIPDRRFERLERGLAIAATREGVTRIMVYAFGREPRARTTPAEFAEIAATWKEVTGEDVSDGEPLWADVFDNRWGLARRYVRGRVLLAGDAAHWHMPIGGQALNLGLQDAVNLGWKLAAVVRGHAPAGLLDSYDEERRAVGAAVLDHVLMQESLLLGGPEMEPVRRGLRVLLQAEAVRDHFAEVAGGLDVRYPV